MEYEYLSPYNGYPTLKINSYIFICIICFIIGIIIIIKSESYEFKNNTTPLLQKIVKIVRNVVLIISLCSFLFYIYLYVVKYLPEYYEWFESLPVEMKTAIIGHAVFNNMRNY